MGQFNIKDAALIERVPASPSESRPR